MLNSPIIEIILTLSFLYFVLSIISSTVYELVGRSYYKRGIFLHKALLEVFEKNSESDWKYPPTRTERIRIQQAKEKNSDWKNQQLKRTLFLSELYKRVLDYSCDDLLRNTLFEWSKNTRIDILKNVRRYPVKIKPSVFTSCIIDYLMDHYDIEKTLIEEDKDKLETPTEEEKFNKLKTTFYELKNENDENKLLGVVPTRFWRVIENIISSSADNTAFETKITAWYEDYSLLMIKNYRWQIKPWLTALGLLMAVTLNIDSIHISKTLWEKNDLRKALVDNIDKQNVALLASIDSTSNNSRDVYQQMAFIDSSFNLITTAGYPIGWFPKDWQEVNTDTTLYYHFKFTSNYVDSILIDKLFKNTKVQAKFTSAATAIFDSPVILTVPTTKITIAKMFDEIKNSDRQLYHQMIGELVGENGKELNLTNNIQLKEKVIVAEHFNSQPIMRGNMSLVDNSPKSFKISMSSVKSIDSIAILTPKTDTTFNFELYDIDFPFNEKDSMVASIHHLSNTGVKIRLDIIRGKETSTEMVDNMVTEIKNNISVNKFIGWLITAFAIGLGAPFWYDILKSITSIRKSKG